MLADRAQHIKSIGLFVMMVSVGMENDTPMSDRLTFIRFSSVSMAAKQISMKCEFIRSLSYFGPYTRAVLEWKKEIVPVMHYKHDRNCHTGMHRYNLRCFLCFLCIHVCLNSSLSLYVNNLTFINQVQHCYTRFKCWLHIYIWIEPIQYTHTHTELKYVTDSICVSVYIRFS